MGGRAGVRRSAVEEYDERGRRLLPATRQHPTLGAAVPACGYAPMVELLRYLEANGFTNYIASGGDRDFMRPVAEDLYGVPPERVIGSALGHSPTRRRTAGRAWSTRPRWTSSTTARRSRCGSGAGSADARSCPGATPTATSRCSAFAGARGRPALRLLVLHDDAEREFAYTAGAEDALELAEKERLDRRQHEERLEHGVRADGRIAQPRSGWRAVA